jgi:hypothetical protein
MLSIVGGSTCRSARRHQTPIRYSEEHSNPLAAYSAAGFGE